MLDECLRKAAMKRFECRAILFDLDGVLVDSTRHIEQQWRSWALAKGLSPEPFLRVCHGRRALETIQLAAPELDAAAEIAAFRPDPLSEVADLPPVEGAAHLLRLLPSGSWAVATSGTRATATARLHGAGLPEPAVLICAEDVVRGKPDPDVYLAAAARMEVIPSECIVVEDARPALRQLDRRTCVWWRSRPLTPPPCFTPMPVRHRSPQSTWVGLTRGVGPRPWLELLVVDR